MLDMPREAYVLWKLDICAIMRVLIPHYTDFLTEDPASDSAIRKQCGIWKTKGYSGNNSQYHAYQRLRFVGSKLRGLDFESNLVCQVLHDASVNLADQQRKHTLVDIKVRQVLRIVLRCDEVPILVNVRNLAVDVVSFTSF